MILSNGFLENSSIQPLEPLDPFSPFEPFNPRKRRPMPKRPFK